MSEAVRILDSASDGLERDVTPGATQRRASDPAASVWVNASAGSGKTTVLTKRVLRLLLAGVKPQRILCLTFTRAAAAEMSIRVMNRLSHWAVCSDDELRVEFDDLQDVSPEPQQFVNARRLFAQVLACPGGLRIRTIHAFCQEILGRFPIEAGLPPHFSVIEEVEADSLVMEAERDLLRQAAAQPGAPLGQALDYLVETLGGKAFTAALRQFLHDRARFAAACQQAGGVEGLTLALHVALGLEPGDRSEQLIAATVAAIPDDLRHAATLLLSGSKTYQGRGQKMLAWLERPLPERAQAFEDYLGCFFTQKGEPFSAYGNKELLKKHPELETILQRETSRLASVQAQLEAMRIAETTQALAVCAEVLIDGYQARKRRQAALDYDDLIIATTALLQRAAIAPWVLYKLDGGLDHMLVDEAQDTSQAQWTIIAALAEEFFAGRGAREDTRRTLFVVGDEKQSIFSFQRADPEAFMAMRHYFARRIGAAGQLYREVPLQVSFRSAPAILQAVDHVFAPAGARDGVSASPVQHFAHGHDKIGRVEVWPLQAAPAAPETEGPWQVPNRYEAETDPQAELADRIADTIKGWLDHGEILAGTDKPVGAGDIMILLRRRGRFADLMVRALKKRGVPVTGVDRMRLVKQLPVMDMLAVLQFALLPEDDLNLATVLRGPLIGFSEEQMMPIAIDRPGTLWHSLQTQAATVPAFRDSVAYLERWLNEADFVTPFALLAEILHQPCPANPRSGRRALWARLGFDALDPIDELLNAAQHFSQRHAPSLQCFLHWLTAADAEIKRELDHGAGQVRIMTVHASKGLEAPVVFLPDAAGLPRSQDVDALLWHDNAHGAVPLYTAKKPAMGLPRQLWEQARQKQMREYRRLLYVALTRAINRLYIAGWETTVAESQNPDSWYNLVKAALQPHHQPAAVGDIAPAPLIVVADADPGRMGKAIKISGKTAAAKGAAAVTVLPDWALRPPAPENRVLPVLVPSQGGLGGPEATSGQPPAATPDAVFTRGRIIHRLLQSLPDVAATERKAAATRFLANPQHGLTAPQQQAICDEVMTLLDHPAYAALFGPGSRAEVPLAGVIEGQPVSGQVDRLALKGEEIWIVDYKTNRPPPKNLAGVPDVYRRQLAAYRLVLQAVYPAKSVRCFLLWTYGPSLMELPAEALSPLN